MSSRWKEGARALGVSWIALTPDERKALCLILALACLGLVAKAWHQRALDREAPGFERQATPAASSPPRLP